MKNIILFLLGIALLTSCNNSQQIIVNNKSELKEAINQAKPGDMILLSDGVWKDVQLKLNISGTKQQAIVIGAVHKGKTFIEGKSYIQMGGKYIIIKDLYFRNGYSPSSAVVRFRLNKDNVATNCKLTNCVFENFSTPNKYHSNHWIEFWGRHNELSHCYISGKTNQGPTVRVFLKGNRNIWTYHKIINNYFAERPRLGGPHGETIQIGSSETSMTPAYVEVSNNLFEKCNGEVEVISIKSNFNTIQNNFFNQCEGSLVLRHGNYNTINANIFKGDGKSPYFGGIRVINTGHRISNNYFYNLKGVNFRAPLAIMNGIPKSPLNRYNQVTDVVVAYNSWINCKSPIQISVGVNTDKKDVLPKSEIRSARPKRTIIANNLIFDTINNNKTVINYDTITGIKSHNNYVDNSDSSIAGFKGFTKTQLNLKVINDYLYLPKFCSGNKLYKGFEFEKINTDLLKNNRAENNCFGAIVPTEYTHVINDKFGPTWFKETPIIKGDTLKVSSSSQLNNIIVKAKTNDVILLTDSLYYIDSTIVIDKNLNINSKKEQEVHLIYTGKKNTTLFVLKSGNLSIKNIDISGENDKNLFTTENSARYNLYIKNCTISKFNYIIKASEGSFADSIIIENSSFDNSTYGICLNAEVSHKGNYNAEYLSIVSCSFTNIANEIINYFRGGYDESTIGGNLLFKSSSVINCGNKSKNNLLINTHGIINVQISNCLFKNNYPKHIAILWKEKNYREFNNIKVNSGEFLPLEHLKLSLMY